MDFCIGNESGQKGVEVGVVGAVGGVGSLIVGIITEEVELLIIVSCTNLRYKNCYRKTTEKEKQPWQKQSHVGMLIVL